MTNSTNFIRSLLRAGRIHFSFEEFQKALGVSHEAALATLRRMRKMLLVASPLEGFHLALSPEYERLKCPPPDQFIHQLMDHLKIRYYVGFLSAAELHGAAHQRPQAFQVAVSEQRRNLRCGEIFIQFTQRKKLDRVPISLVNSKTTQFRVSTPEVTAFDLVSSPSLGGGLNNVATVLSELQEALDPQKLADVSELFSHIIGQRLGFLLELVGAMKKTGALLKRLEPKMKVYTPLEPSRKMTGAKRNARWKVAINTDVEPDL